MSQKEQILSSRLFTYKVFCKSYLTTFFLLKITILKLQHTCINSNDYLVQRNLF